MKWNRLSTMGFVTWVLMCPDQAVGSSDPDFGIEVAVVWTGLENPTALRFAADGRVFVAEKAGIVRVFDSLDDSESEVVIDLREATHDDGDRGLLGIALHPDFPVRPDVYVLYTYDAPPGEIAPYWNDTCPTPPGDSVDGCVVEARLSRFTLFTESTGPEEVLIEGGFCQQFPSHSIGTVTFGLDGALYLGAGDGAHLSTPDFGQYGGTLAGTPTPANPCGDPPGGQGLALIPPDAEGGALRSQDLLTLDDPVGLDGTILRVDPDTGDALPDNPLVGGMEGDDRIIAFGLRNPYRFAIHPRTNQIWIGDVGWNDWEEVNLIEDPTDSLVENFGWPCFEGPEPQPRYDAVDLTLCEDLYATPKAVTSPYFAYHHEAPPDPVQCDPIPNAAITGIAFLSRRGLTPSYSGALVFADGAKSCIWVMANDENGFPDPEQISTLASSVGNPVHLESGPGGDLFVVDIFEGAVRRLIFGSRILADGFESGDLSGWE